MHFAKAGVTMVYRMVLSDRTMKEEIAKRRIVIELCGPVYLQLATIDVHLGRSFWFSTVGRYYKESANEEC